MAEVKLKNLLRLYKLRNKFDAVVLAVHACLVERGFRCINSGEEVRSSSSLERYLRKKTNRCKNAVVICKRSKAVYTLHM